MPNRKANASIPGCFECHLPHAKQDFVMSLVSLCSTAPGAALRPSGRGAAAIAEFLFGLEKVMVKAGQTIAWPNIDDSPHRVTEKGATARRTPVILKDQERGATV